MVQPHSRDLALNFELPRKPAFLFHLCVRVLDLPVSKQLQERLISEAGWQVLQTRENKYGILWTRRLVSTCTSLRRFEGLHKRLCFKVLFKPYVCIPGGRGREGRGEREKTFVISSSTGFPPSTLAVLCPLLCSAHKWRNAELHRCIFFQYLAQVRSCSLWLLLTGAGGGGRKKSTGRPLLSVEGGGSVPGTPAEKETQGYCSRAA